MFIPIKIYKNSLLASLTSLLGSILFLCGIGLCFSGEGEIAGGIIMIILGAGSWFLASYIATSAEKRKNEKKRRKFIQDPMLDQKIAASCVTALEYIQAFPTPDALARIRMNNEFAASQIELLLQNKITLEYLTNLMRNTDKMRAQNPQYVPETAYVDGNVVDPSVTAQVSPGMLALDEQKRDETAAKCKSAKKLRNIFIIAVPVFVLIAVLTHNLTESYREYFPFTHNLQANVYTSAEVIGITTIAENYKYDTETLEKQYTESYYCLFIDKNDQIGIANISYDIYNSDALKPAIEYISNDDAPLPTPVMLYGELLPVPQEVKNYIAEEGLDASSFGEYYIDASLSPEKQTSALTTLFILLAVAALVAWFVFLLIANYRENQYAKMNLDIASKRLVLNKVEAVHNNEYAVSNSNIDSENNN